MRLLTKKLLILLVLLPLMSGCSSSMVIQDYKNNQPTLDLLSYFDGNTKGWGIFQDRKGKLKRQFVVDLNGYKNEKGNFVLEEDFVWNDGEKTKRIWTIQKNGNNNYIGTAPDIVGQAVGTTSGNAFHWEYVMNLPVGDKTYKVKFDDWMFLQPDGILLNKAKMSKFGLHLGEVIISFKK